MTAGTKVAAAQPVVEGVLAALRTGTGKLIGDGDKPVHHETDPKRIYPYGILYLNTLRLDGSLVNPKEDGVYRVQVKCVGLARKQAELLRDTCRQILCDLVNSVDVDGHVLHTAELVSEQSSREDAQGDRPAIFTADVIVNMQFTPLT